MTKHLDRREFIQLAGLTTAGIAGVVFSSGLRGVSLAAAKGRAEEFMFLQMSDLHWGFTGPAVNPDAEVTLDKAIAHVNALPRQPDFIAFTGDLTHTTDDPPEAPGARARRGREAQGENAPLSRRRTRRVARPG
jgi:predicted MPP superfamily phosphohydrolase